MIDTTMTCGLSYNVTVTLPPMTEDDFRTYIQRKVDDSCGSVAALARKHSINPKSLTLFLSGVRGASPDVAAAFGFQRLYAAIKEGAANGG